MQTDQPSGNSHSNAIRLPLPEAYIDPAYQQCLVEACNTPTLLENFERLSGCKISGIAKGSSIEKMIDQVTGFRDDQLRHFAEFVHDSVYMRLPDEAIHALRNG